MKALKRLALGLCFLCFFTTGAHASSYIMTYCFAGNSTIYKNNLEKTEGAIDTLSPSWFDLNADGSLSIAAIDEDFVATLHGEGRKITPFLSNHWLKEAGNACLNRIDDITSQIADAVAEYRLDGVNVDIQNVDETYREKYSLFVKTLRQKLPEKMVTVAVAANPKGWTLGWHGSYDYAALAEYSDYLMIMAYDESYYGSLPGPVASRSFVEDSIRYALRYTSPDKLVLGIPFFGRYWKDDAPVGGSGIAMADVERLLEKYPAALRHDTDLQAVELRITLDAPYTLWGGNVLSAGDYTIWYDNLETLLYKVGLVNQYKLRGLGCWALGQENPNFWSLCRESLQNLVFDDISGHWAEEFILSVYELGWMQGEGDVFRPDDSITRAEVACALLRVCNVAQKPAGGYFSDTAGHWAEAEISLAAAYGLVQGYTDGSFRPASPITREELAVLLDRMLILSLGLDFNVEPFTDLTKAEHTWSYDAIMKLYGVGAYQGYPDGSFRPQDKVTRGEFSALLDRIQGFGIAIGQKKGAPRVEMGVEPR